MADVVLIGSVDDARDFLGRIDNFSRTDLSNIVLGGWVKTKVYIPETSQHSEITPPYMEAFLEIQRVLYEFVAYAEYEIPSVRLLNDSQRQSYQLSIKVEGGSSYFSVDFSKLFQGVLPLLAQKVSGRGAAIVILGIAVLVAGDRGFSSWLETEKQIRLESLKSKEHLEALRALSLSAENQHRDFEKLVELVKSQGAAGAVALQFLAAHNDALAKAASKTPLSMTNGQQLYKHEAELLRTPVRRSSTKRTEIRKVRVVQLNTADPIRNTVLLWDVESQLEYSTVVPNGLFWNGERRTLIESLDTGMEIWVEIFMKEVGGDVRSVDFIRISEDPGR